MIKGIVFLCILIIIILAAMTCISQTEIKVLVDDKPIVFDQQPVIKQGRTLVPIRAIFEELQIQLQWEEETSTIIGLKDNKSIVLQVGNRTAFIDGEKQEMDVAPILLNSRTLVPARFIAESTGAVVEWVESKTTVKITSANRAVYRTITPQVAKKKIESGVDIYLIDVRIKQEYEQGHIKGSILLPLNELMDRIEVIAPDKNSEVIIYCRSGNRSKTAARMLLDIGYKNVYDLGGIINWPYEIER